jgi:hypothetical protein
MGSEPHPCGPKKFVLMRLLSDVVGGIGLPFRRCKSRLKIDKTR